MRAPKAPVRLMSTRALVEMIATLGLNADTVAALKAVGRTCDVQPSVNVRLRPRGVLQDEADDTNGHRS